MDNHVLEPAAQKIADATSKPPFLYEIGVDAARKVLDDIQAAPAEKPARATVPPSPLLPPLASPVVQLIAS